MPSAAEYADMLRARLPEGPAWNTSDQTDGATAWDMLLAALSQEPARIDADLLSLLDKVIPDNEDTDLDAWERIITAPDTNLTDAQRLARIRALLQPRGNVNLETLQNAARTMAGDDNVVLFNRARPKCAAGVSNAGDACGAHGFEWLCELYANFFTAGPDAVWVGIGVTVVANDQQSPVTLAQTAQSITFTGGFAAKTGALEDDTDFSGSVWLRAAAGVVTVTLGTVDKNGTTTTTSVDLTTNWRRYTLSGNSATGSGNAGFYITGTPSDEIYVSWAVAGAVDEDLEERISALFPIHTRGVFGTQGEFATILGQDQAEVTF